jgi:hypothetical protein
MTQGEQWPTGTVPAFAQTEELDLLFNQNLMKRPQATVMVDTDTRDLGTVATFENTQTSMPRSRAKSSAPAPPGRR